VQAATAGLGMTHDEAIAEITRRCWALGVYVQLSPKDAIDIGDGVPCSGFFDDEHGIPIIAVATGKPKTDWLKIMLHEYGHATQWAEQTPLWNICKKTGSWIDWLEGKSVRDIQKAIETSRDLEADCERRTVRLIRELELDIDIEAYSRAANAYVHFYNFMLIHRKWFAKDKAPYKVPEVMAAANPAMDADFTKTPKALMKALELCIE
jgi:hypothetical protein